MKTLLVIATEQEVTSSLQNTNIPVLITGIGMMQTTYSLVNYLHNNQVDLVINAGIAGAFKESTLNIGDVVLVKEQLFGDLGAEDQDRFIDIFDLGLMQADQFPFESKKITNPHLETYKLPKLTHVKSITVNKVHGKQSSINQVYQKYQPDIESMEGMAVSFVCSQQQVPWLEIRAISNYIESRDRGNWNIELAVSNLNSVIEAGMLLL